MTIEERVRLAMSGLRMRSDEVQRPASHDEIEAVLRKTLEDFEADMIASAPRIAKEVVEDAFKDLSEETKP
jgi:hypothetical protein